MIGDLRNLNRLISELGEEETKRFEDAHEVLAAEKELLEVAVEKHAGRFPTL